MQNKKNDAMLAYNIAGLKCKMFSSKFDKRHDIFMLFETFAAEDNINTFASVFDGYNLHWLP